MSEDELQALLARTLPAGDLHGLMVEEIEDQDVRLRFPGGASLFSAPTLLAFVDAALRAAVLAAAGPSRSVQPTNLNVTFLKAAQVADAMALARVIRKDNEIVHAEAWLFSHAVVDPMLHATATLALKPLP